MAFRNTYTPNKAIPADFENFRFSVWPVEPAQNGEIRDFGIFGVFLCSKTIEIHPIFGSKKASKSHKNRFYELKLAQNLTNIISNRFLAKPIFFDSGRAREGPKTCFFDDFLIFGQIPKFSKIIKKSRF